MRNIPIESPPCNLVFWPASQSTYPSLLLTYTSHLFAQLSHHLISSCSRHIPPHLRVTDATFENLTATT